MFGPFIIGLFISEADKQHFCGGFLAAGFCIVIAADQLILIYEKQCFKCKWQNCTHITLNLWCIISANRNKTAYKIKSNLTTPAHAVAWIFHLQSIEYWQSLQNNKSPATLTSSGLVMLLFSLRWYCIICDRHNIISVFHHCPLTTNTLQFGHNLIGHDNVQDHSSQLSSLLLT